jgi:hypothetical protein
MLIIESPHTSQTNLVPIKDFVYKVLRRLCTSWSVVLSCVLQHLMDVGVCGTAECGGYADTFRFSSLLTAALHKGRFQPMTPYDRMGINMHSKPTRR